MLYSYLSLLNWPVANTATTTEKDGSYVLELELPRFKKSDVTIEVNDSVLSVKAERAENKYQYSTTLSESIDVNNITSKLEDGVLSIILPKTKKKINGRKILVE